MTQKPKDWNGECPARACTRFAHATDSRELSATDDFFVVSDMGSYYNVYRQHHYSANTSDAVLTDLKAGLDSANSTQLRTGQWATLHCGVEVITANTHLTIDLVNNCMMGRTN